MQCMFFCGLLLYKAPPVLCQQQVASIELLLGSARASNKLPANCGVGLCFRTSVSDLLRQKQVLSSQTLLEFRQKLL